jgi:hypothetical protein
MTPAVVFVLIFVGFLIGGVAVTLQSPARGNEVKDAFMEGLERASHDDLSAAEKERHWAASDARERLVKPLD